MLNYSVAELRYNIKTHPFFLKRDFSKRLLNDEFQKFWEKKKNVKIPLSAIWLVQRDFFVYYSSLLYQVRDFTSRSSLPS